MPARVFTQLMAAVCSLLLALVGNVTHSSDKTSHDVNGSLEGVVTFRGEVPRARIADNAGQRRRLLNVDRQTRGVEYIVVFLRPPESGWAATTQQHAGKDQPAVVIDQLEETFVPHLIAIRGGRTVRFTNSDPANHNVRAASLDEANQFNIFTGAGQEYRHQFRANSRGLPVLLGSDIHPWMRAWIYVFDHPYFDATDKKGRFTIEDIPPGEYVCVVRQPDVGYNETREVVVESGKTTRLDLQMSVKKPRP